MAVTKREYIFGTFIVSCISLGLLLGAIGSQNWVSGKATIASGTVELNYGLFRGTATKSLLATPELSTLYVTCNYKENVCLVTCKLSSEARQAQITSLLEGCSVNTACNSNVETCQGGTANPDIKWFNSGIYISNLLFLGIAIIMAALSALIAVYNTAKIPVEPLLGIFGLYIWNACAAFSNFIVLLLWGIHFKTKISESLAYTDLMIPSSSNTVESSVGLSYWLVLVSLFLHMISPGFLYLRQRLIDREPPPPTINIDKNTDDTIFLY